MCFCRSLCGSVARFYGGGRNTIRKLFFYLSLAGMLPLAIMGIASAQSSSPRSQAGSPAALGTAAAEESTLSAVDGLSTGFTYQGERRNASGPVTGSCNFQFSLWDTQADGAQIGSTRAVNSVAVSNGRFVVELNGSGQFAASALPATGVMSRSPRSAPATQASRRSVRARSSPARRIPSADPGFNTGG